MTEYVMYAETSCIIRMKYLLTARIIGEIN